MEEEARDLSNDHTRRRKKQEEEPNRYKKEEEVKLSKRARNHLITLFTITSYDCIYVQKLSQHQYEDKSGRHIPSLLGSGRAEDKEERRRSTACHGLYWSLSGIEGSSRDWVLAETTRRTARLKK